MNARIDSEPTLVPRHGTSSTRTSECELVTTRAFDAAVPIVFAAWTRPKLFKQWWVPKSSGLQLTSCVQDVRVGGSYRLEFARPGAATPLAFFGQYLAVVPNARLVWTNAESDQGEVTTLTFEERAGQTLIVLSERYSSKLELDRAISGMAESLRESFQQLDDFLLN